MPEILKSSARAIRLGLACVSGLLHWTAWLVLSPLLLFQAWMLTSMEISVPSPLREAIRERLASSQLEASFGRTLFDPAGHVLIENIRIGAPAFSEPLFTARAVYAELDISALLAGDFVPRVVRATGVSFHVPAMFSASGLPEEVISGADFSARLGEREIDLDHLTARLGRLTLAVSGTIPVADWRSGDTRGFPLADFLSQRYPRMSRAFADAVVRFDAFEDPLLKLALSADPGGILAAEAEFQASRAAIDGPAVADAERIEASTRILFGSPDPFDAPLRIRAGRLALPGGIRLEEANVLLQGRVESDPIRYEPGRTQLISHRASVDSIDIPVTGLVATLDSPPKDGRVSGEIHARVAGVATRLGGEADFARGSADLEAETTLSPELLDLAAEHLGAALRAQLALLEPVPLRAGVRLEEGWRPAEVDTWVESGPVVVRGVRLDSTQAQVRFSDGNMQAERIVLTRGPNVVRGNYGMDVGTNDFRFLLDGQLQPMEIAGWFREWWTRLFSQFEFEEIPEADVDIQGRWGDRLRSSAFVGVRSGPASVRSVPFDRVDTEVFARPGHTDVRHFHGWRDDGDASGRFTRSFDVLTRQMLALDFDVTSRLPLEVPSQLFGELGTAIIEPYSFETPPRLQVSGRIDGAASPGGGRRDIRIAGGSAGGFSVFGFPLADASFEAHLVDDLLEISNIGSAFANGRASGQVTLSGRGAEQQIDLSISLSEGRLGPAVSTVSRFLAERRGTEPPAPGTYLVRAGDLQLDLSLAARGPAHNLLGLTGSGSATLAGSELGEVRLLGVLSDLFTFSSLRFTRLATDFNLQGATLTFPNLRLTGANSAVDASGTYAMDRKALDIRARAYPFQESNALLQSAVGAVLTPLSEILEVRLTGSLENPTWAFVAGPTNILRSLAEPAGATAPTQAAPEGPPSQAPATQQ